MILPHLLPDKLLRCFVYCPHIFIAFFSPPTLIHATSVKLRAVLGHCAVVFSLFKAQSSNCSCLSICPQIWILWLSKNDFLQLQLLKEPHRRTRCFGSFGIVNIGTYTNLWGLFPVVRPPSFTSHQSENFPRDIPHVRANVLRCMS